MAEHIVPRKTYLLIFGVLLVLTLVTVWVSTIDLGRLNVLVALAIAVGKALLVVLYFMHVRYSGRMTRLVLIAGVFWLLILFALTMSDYLTRRWLSL